MRRHNALLYGTATLVCTLCAAAAQADPVTEQLFYTTYNGGANIDEVTSVTLSGSTLTFTGNQNIATTTGADGILFLPDGNLAIGGQGGGGGGAQIHEITTGGVAVANVNTPFNGSTFDGSYHLALSSNSPTATLYTLCNGECGANFSRTTLVGSGLQNGTTATNITVNGGTSQDVRGLIFDPVNGKWYYGTAGDGSTAGTFGTVTFGPGNTATLTQLLSNVPAHGLTFDPFTNDIIFSSGNMIDQFDPTSGMIVSTFTGLAGDAYDQSAADGHGHLFVASNNGNLVGLDYDSTGLIGTGSSAEKFLAANLDDIAPLSGAGATPTPEPASLALLATGPSSGSVCSGAAATECKKPDTSKATGGAFGRRRCFRCGMCSSDAFSCAIRGCEA